MMEMGPGDGARLPREHTLGQRRRHATTLDAEHAEVAWFDRLTMSARPELVEGRFLR
jgi:hypothetical protein